MENKPIFLGEKIIKVYNQSSSHPSSVIKLTDKDWKFNNLKRYDRIETMHLKLSNREIKIYNKEIVQFGFGLGIIIPRKEMYEKELKVGDRVEVTLTMIKEQV